MNRFKIRLRVAVVGLVAVLAPGLSGCGTGQISQTAAQEPAVNGNRVTVDHVALRDVRIQAAQTGDFLQPGQTVDLALVAVNLSPEKADRLQNITSDIGPVTLSNDALPAACTLIVGTPEGQAAAPAPPQCYKTAKATVNLTRPITNGITYNFTFNFEQAGPISVLVPVSAGPASQQA